MEIDTVRTENLALSHGTTNSAVVNLFFKVLRGTTVEAIEKYLDEAWKESPILTTKAIFQLRDCRGGKGERKAFHDCMRWLVRTHPNTAKKNIENVAFFGTYKDLLTVFANGPLEIDALTVFARALADDSDALERNENVSLAAKWAPTEGGSLDKKHKFSKKLIGLLRTKCKPVTQCVNSREYRLMCTRLRAKIGIVEAQMCAQKWDTIDFEKVPSVALKIYRKAFEKHTPEYAKYLSRVRIGEAKIHARVFPHELVKHYLCGGKFDETIEAQWKELVKKTRELYAAAGANAFPLVDVSSSMRGQPMEVAIALGLLLAEIGSNEIMTFESEPHIVTIPDGTLQAKVRIVRNMPWGGHTNLQAALDRLLQTILDKKLTRKQQPKTLFIFSDMQFNVACPDVKTWGNGKPENLPSYASVVKGEKTNFQMLEEKYKASGLTRPNIVFWNLKAGTVDFPVTQHVSRCALVSGFSQDLLSLFLKGIVISPYCIVLDALNAPRYERVTVAGDL